MLIYSTPFPCCPSCEMQADDAIPPREKERRRGGNRRKEKEHQKHKPANSRETISQCRILLACPKLHKLFLKGLQELLSSPHGRQDWNQGVPDPSVPKAPHPDKTSHPPSAQAGKASGNRLTILKTKQSCHHHLCLLKLESKPRVVISPN